MRTKQFLLAVLLSVIGVINSFGYEYTDANGVKWMYNTGTYGGVTGAYIYGVTNCPEDVVVPDFVENSTTKYVVRWLGNPNSTSSNYATFYNNTVIKTVKFPETIIAVYDYIFRGCTNLTTVGDLSSCTRIGANAFYGCSSLTTVGDLSACTSIGASAFSGCNQLENIHINNIASWCQNGSKENILNYGKSSKKLFVNGVECTNLVIPDKVNAISDYAFKSFGNIVSVTLPNSVTSIGNYAFRDCASLTSLGNLPYCTSIGKSAFYGCTSLNSTGDFHACTSIGNYAFYNCTSLNSVGDFPACTTIGDQAFSKCYSLTTIGDFSACTSIGASAFSGCNQLENIHVNNIALWCKTCDKYEILNRGKTEKKLFVNGVECTNLVIPDEVEMIINNAFRYFANIETVTIPNTVRSIGNSAFYGCTAINRVSGLGAVSIGDNAFENCSSLTTVGDLSACTSIGVSSFNSCPNLSGIIDLSSCTSIGDNAFQGCRIKKVTLSSQLLSIGNSAFAKANILSDVNCKSVTPPTLGNSVFSANVLCVVPAGSIDAYKEATNWSSLYTNNQITTESSYNDYTANIMAAQDKSALHMNIGDTNLSKVVSLKVTGTMNSYDIMIIRNKMPSLRHLDLSDADIVANDYQYYTGYHSEDNILGPYALSKSASLKLATIKLPKSLISLADKSLAYNDLVADIDLSETHITNIASEAFNSCVNLRTVELPEGLTKINSKTFYFCSSLESIHIPSTVVSLAEYAFGGDSGGCTGLQTITFDDNSQLESIGNGAFYRCTSLQSITLPKNVSTIGDRAFYGCTNLKDVVFSPGITYVSNFMFDGCYNLERVSMPSTIQKIGGHAFSGCSSIKEFQIPESVKSIASYAFSGCTNLKDIYSYTVEPTSIDQYTFSTYTSATLHVPEQAYYNYFYDTQWSQFLTVSTVLKTFDYFYAYKDVTIGTGTGGVFVGDPVVDLYPGAGVIVKDNLKQTFADLNLNVDDPNKSGALYPSVIADENTSLDVKDGSHLFVNIEITANKWYYFCFPFNIEIARIKKAGNWIFREYDGDARAQGDSGWKNLNDGSTHLTAGKGYIFQSNTGGTLTLEIDAPDFTAKDIATEIVSHAVSGTGSATDADWNFVGNPFTSYYDLDALGYDCPVTFWNGTTYETVRRGDDNYSFHPFQAFFVQKPDAETISVGFEAENRETRIQSETTQSRKARMRMALAKDGSERMIINLELSDGKNVDKTRVVYNAETSAEYETSCDAAKFFSSEAVPQLYTLDAKNTEYSINELPASDVRVGVKIAAKGHYTIAAVRMDIPVLLEDKLTGSIFDLSEEAYSFESEAGSFDNRFILRVGAGTNAIVNAEVEAENDAEYYTVGGVRTKANAVGIKIKKNGNTVTKVLK